MTKGNGYVAHHIRVVHRQMLLVFQKEETERERQLGGLLVDLVLERP